MRRWLAVSEFRFVRLLAAASLGLLWSVGAIAHHSFSSIYDSGKTVTLTAIVREFQFINPHPMLIVEVRGDSGQPQTWRAEMDRPARPRAKAASAKECKRPPAVTIFWSRAGL